MLAILDLGSFQLCLDYLRNCMLETSNFCKAVEDNCLQDLKTMHHHANDHFDWLISGHQNVDGWREATFVLSEKYSKTPQRRTS